MITGQLWKAALSAARSAPSPAQSRV